MLRSKPIRWLGIGLIWLLLAGALLELGLRVFVASLPPKLQAVTNTVINGTPFGETWDRAWIRNPEHFFILKPGLVDALQFSTPQVRFHVNTIELWEGGGIGFRNRPVDYFVDIVVVGDSFAFCFTEHADCWVSQLEAETGMGVVNLGLPGTGSRSHQLVLRDFGSPLQPPLVIWQFFGNDFNDDYGLAVSRGELEPLDAPTVESGENVRGGSIRDWLRGRSVLFAVAETVLTGQRHDLDAVGQQFEDRYEARLATGEVLRFGQPYEPQAMDMERPSNQAGYEISRESFEAARDLVANWGGQLMVALVPTREEVYSSLTAQAMGADLTAIQSARLAMLELCADLEVPCYDALADLQVASVENPLLYYVDDMHLNARGNRIFSELVHDWLSAQNLLRR